MAYVIGSKNGQNIAKTLTEGKSWTNPTDGSIWTKEKDGSVTVTHNGQTTTNAYKPTSNSTGGSSGGGTSNKNTNSQYTNIYGNVDLGTLGQNYMKSGADWRTVKDIYDARREKAMSSPELNQFADDDIQKALYDYYMKGMKAENRPKENEYYDAYEDVVKNRPNDYNAKYDPQIDALLNEILNREDFSYDAMNDPLYQQYAEMYRREGDRAMKETLAEAAASAGGMNSYAITAAQQAANRYASQLNDKIPELYQLAYDMYLADKESKVQDLGILQSMDATQYNRYRDTMSDWKDDRQFAYGMYQDAVQQGNWQTTFDYNSMVDDRNFNFENFWANKEFNAQQELNDYNKSTYEKEQAKADVWKYIEMGITSISPDLISKADMTQEEVNLAVAAVQAEKNKKTTKTEPPYGGDTIVNPISEEMTTAMSNYKPIDETCKELLMTEGKQEVLEFLKERFEAGEIDTNSYNTLRNKYAG